MAKEPDIMLSKYVFYKWVSYAKEIAKELPKDSIIHDESWEITTTNELRVFCDITLPDGTTKTAEKTFDECEWTYKQ